MEKRLINLTGHPLRISDAAGHHLDLQPYGEARVSSKFGKVEDVTSGEVTVPLLDIEEQRLIGLPNPERGTLFIVTGIVAAVAQRQYGREDVVAPSRLTRSSGGWVTECRALLLPREKEISE